MKRRYTVDDCWENTEGGIQHYIRVAKESKRRLQGEIQRIEANIAAAKKDLADLAEKGAH